MMNPIRKILPLLVAGLVVLMNFTGAALASQPPEPDPHAVTAAQLEAELPPPTPVFVWGTVKLDGVFPPVGTKVAAWIDGVKCAEMPSITDQSRQVYGFNIPDNNHLNVTACAYASGKVVQFTVGSTPAIETLTYTTAATYQKDLTAVTPDPSYKFYLPIVRR